MKSHLFRISNVFQQVKHPNFNMTILFMAASIFLSNMFIYCFFGRLATDSFAKMADRLYEANWQVLPIELQKYFILMIANMQVPLEYSGLGIIVLNLETFCLVSVYSENETSNHSNAIDSKLFMCFDSSWCDQLTPTTRCLKRWPNKGRDSTVYNGYDAHKRICSNSTESIFCRFIDESF